VVNTVASLTFVAPDSGILKTSLPPYPGKLTKAERKQLDRISDLLMDTPNAIAIAAPQVGVPIRAFVVRNGGGTYVMVNPVVVWHSDSDPDEIILGPGNTPIPRRSPSWERCLSIPDVEHLVIRPQLVKIEYSTIKDVRHRASYQGFHARVVAHEVDHLNGILISDVSNGHRSIEEGDGAEACM